MVDYQYYCDEYLRGREPPLSKTDFPYYAQQAEQYVSTGTFGRSLLPENVDLPEVKNCVCSIAELMAAGDKASAQSGGGAIASESVGGHSVSFVSAEAAAEATAAKMQKALDLWLANTGLLYAGVC